MDSSVTINRLACRFKIPDGLENSGAVVDQLERIARREVAQACAQLIAELPGDEEAIYRIRRLHLNLWVDAQGMSEAEIAQRWGALMARAVMQAMTRGSSRDVMRFDSPLQFVTAFLRDLLRGNAWGRWYYDEFQALQSLPAPAIAVQMLIARPDWIAPVLLELNDTALIERWTEADIVPVWSALGIAVIAPASSKSATLLLLWQGSNGLSRDARARDKLRLWLALAEAQPHDAHDPQFLGLIGVLVDVVALIQAEPEAGPLLAMGSDIYPALLARISNGPVADVLDWLATTDPAVIIPIVEASWGREVRPSALSSDVGGVFLLIPALLEMGVWSLWRDEVGEDAARRYLFVAALKALGHDRAPLLLADPMLAAFAGLDAPPTADARIPAQADGAAGQWFDALPESTMTDADRAYLLLGPRLGYPWLTPSLDSALSVVTWLALRRTAARLPGFARSGAVYTARQFLAQPASLQIHAEVIEVRLNGGPLSVVLGLAGLPWEMDVPWLAHQLRLMLPGGLDG